MVGFDFIKMAPHNEVIQAGIPEKATARCLAEPGKAYAIYIKGGTRAKLKLALPKGEYTPEWINPRTGDTVRATASGAAADTWESPQYAEDIALRIRVRE